MSKSKTAEDKILELAKEHADAIKEAQSQPGLREFTKLFKSARRYRQSPRRIKDDARGMV